MKASYELTADDLAAFVEFHQQASPAARNQRLGCFIVALIALLVLPVGIVLTTDEPRLQTAIDIWPLLLGPIFFALFAFPYIRWRTRQLSRRLLREGQNSGFYGKCELIVADDGLTELRPAGSTMRKWSSVERVVTTARHLFVYTSGIEAFVVPRHAFDTQDDFDAFVHAIAERSGVTVDRA